MGTYMGQFQTFMRSENGRRSHEASVVDELMKLVFSMWSLLFVQKFCVLVCL